MRLDERRLAEIWTRHLGGAPLTESERRELLEAALADTGMRDELVADERVHHGVASLARSAGDGDAFVGRVTARLAEARPRPQGRRVRVVAAVAASLALAAALALLIGRPPPERPAATASGPMAPAPEEALPAEGPARRAGAMIERVRGDAFVVAATGKVPARSGTRLAADEGVVTVGSASGAQLALPGGGRLELAADTTAMPISSGGAPVVFVAQGMVRVAAAVPAGGPPLRLQTPHAEATATGAVLALVVDGGKTRLEVVAGRATFRGNRHAASIDVTAGQQALTAAEGEGNAPMVVDRTPGRRVLFVVGSDPPELPDRLVKQRLEGLGFPVEVRASASVGLDEEARVSALVAISSTVDSGAVGPLFRDLPVPVVVWEPALYDDMGMIGPRDPDILAAAPGAEVVIGETTHPLAAGLSGRVRVTDRMGNNYLSQGTPAPTAHWIASMPGDPTRATIFAYERDVPMVELPAPARRVGLFVSDLGPQHMTRAGWALFDAAIRWAADGR